MYKLINKMYSRFAVVYGLLILVMAISLSSCSSTKAKRFKNTPNYTVKANPVTKRLFMQYKRVNVALPPNEGGEDGANLTERVSYKNMEMANVEEEEQVDSSGLKTNQTQKLKEVAVIGKSRSTPERDGMITVGFNVVVPKEMVATDWRVYLTPRLLHNDSIVDLEKIVINGEKFLEKQKQDYADYEAFLNTLVDKSKYDSAYFDKKGTHQDIVERQNIYWQAYHKEWEHLMNFEKWLVEKANKDAFQLAKDESFRINTLHEQLRKANRESAILMVQNKDTTGVTEKHLSQYDKKTAKIFEKQETGQDYDIKKIPSKFRDLYNSPYSLEDLTNFNFTEQDSIDIAKHRYDFEAIVFNEMDIARKEEIFDNMITYAEFDNKREFRVDTTLAEGGEDFIYTFYQDYPVSPGLKSIRITMDGKVQGLDRSSYNLPKMDTLAFFVSSIVQLADTSLIYKRTRIHNEVYMTNTLYDLQYKGKSTAYDPSLGENGSQMDKTINAINIYLEKPDYRLDSVTIQVTTTLDGDYTNNLELVEKRAQGIEQYLRQTFAGNSKYDPKYVIKESSGEDWNGLAREIKKNTNMPNKDAVLEMIANTTHPDETEKELAKQFPEDFKIIKKDIYPRMSKAFIGVDVVRVGQTEAVSIEEEYREDYELGLKYLMDREYDKALEILKEYPDYNAALCLVAMGYNQKAEEVLKSIEATGRSEYIYAMVCARSNRESEAVEHLKKACELDSSMAYRVTLDPDINALVKKYNLMSTLEGGSGMDIPVEQPAVEQPAVEQPAAEQPAVEQPAATTQE